MLSIKRILCPVDFSEWACRAVEVADELASRFSAELLLLHVIEPIPLLGGAAGELGPESFTIAAYDEEMKRAAEVLLKETRNGLKQSRDRARTMVVHGHAASEVLRVASAEKVDLIVVAARGRSGHHLFGLGSVAERIVRHTTCPVLTIPCTS